MQKTLYDTEKISAIRRKLAELPPRGEPIEVLREQVENAIQRGYTLKELSSIFEECGISIPYRKLARMFQASKKSTLNGDTRRENFEKEDISTTGYVKPNLNEF